jgi:hypothetical protein
MILTLRPANDIVHNLGEYPATSPHGGWFWVNEEVPDSSNYVVTSGAMQTYDLYGYGNPIDITGSIAKVTLFARVLGSTSYASAATALRTHGALYYGTEQALTGTPAWVSTEYALNPYTSVAWIWSEILDGALQAGPLLYAGSSSYTAKCDNFYVQIEKRLSVARGQIIGLTW